MYVCMYVYICIYIYYIKMLLFGSDRGCLFAFADVSKNLLQVAVGGCLHGSAGNIIVVWPYDHCGNQKCH